MHPVRQRSAASRRIIERLRKLCLALPEATEKMAWGEPTWRVKGRLFAQLDDHHHGSPHCSVWLPAELGVQETLVEADPQRFFRPPYVGHKGWIGIVLDTKPDWGVVEELVRGAYRLIAPAKLGALLEVEPPAPLPKAVAKAKPRPARSGRTGRLRETPAS